MSGRHGSLDAQCGAGDSRVGANVIGQKKISDVAPSYVNPFVGGSGGE